MERRIDKFIEQLLPHMRSPRVWVRQIVVVSLGATHRASLPVIVHALLRQARNEV